MNENRGHWRGKRVKNGEWVTGDFSRIKATDQYFITVNLDGQSWKVDPSTLGECTGLKDQNNKLIFEGDIIEHKGERFVIKYLEKYMRFSPVKLGTVFTVFDYTQSEIIGNVHDNPELIESEASNNETQI